MNLALNEEDAGVPWIHIIMGKSVTTLREELWVAPPITSHAAYVEFFSQKDGSKKDSIPTLRGNRLCLLLFSWLRMQLSTWQ